MSIDVSDLLAEKGVTIGDLFCRLYDGLRVGFAEGYTLIDDVPKPLNNEFAQNIRLADGTIPDVLWRYLDENSRQLSREAAFSVCLTIDSAFHSFHHTSATHDPSSRSWPRTRRHLKRTGSLTKIVQGVLLPCRHFPDAGRGHLRSAFRLRRMIELDIPIGWSELEPSRDILPQQSPDGKSGECVHVAFIPTLDADDVEFARNGDSFVVSHTPDGEMKAKDRVLASLRAADAKGIQIVLAPELSLTTAAWEEIGQELNEQNRRSNRGIRLALLGSALALVNSGKPPSNRARVVYADGADAWHQDKVNEYVLKRGHICRYGLKSLLGDDDLKEEMTSGSKLWLVDSPRLGRIAITICEDVRRETARYAMDLGARVFLVPVMDGPQAEQCWTDDYSKVLKNMGGASSLVINSLVFPQVAYESNPEKTYYNPPHGFALIRLPSRKHPEILYAVAADTAERGPYTSRYIPIR